MIYSLDPAKYPQGDMLIEELIYKDLNELEWRIARTKVGFVVKYCGEPYFKTNNFSCEISDNKIITIKNTGVVVFMNTDFNSFCEIRTVLTTNYTDGIWECFQGLFTVRLHLHPIVMLSELI